MIQQNIIVKSNDQLRLRTWSCWILLMTSFVPFSASLAFPSHWFPSSRNSQRECFSPSPPFGLWLCRIPAERRYLEEQHRRRSTPFLTRRGQCVLWSEVLVFHRFFVDLVFLCEVVVALSYLCFMPIFLDGDLFFGRAASLSSCTVADCSSWFVGCCWLSAVLSQLMLAVKGNTNVN